MSVGLSAHSLCQEISYNEKFIDKRDQDSPWDYEDCEISVRYKTSPDKSKKSATLLKGISHLSVSVPFKSKLGDREKFNRYPSSHTATLCTIVRFISKGITYTTYCSTQEIIPVEVTDLTFRVTVDHDKNGHPKALPNIFFQSVKCKTTMVSDQGKKQEILILRTPRSRVSEIVSEKDTKNPKAFSYTTSTFKNPHT